jgi:Reverse transcriptase (RNA-dependent DNA polymerase)
MSEEGTWEFLQWDRHGNRTYHMNLADLPPTWRYCLLDGLLHLGWLMESRAYHVHAQGLWKGVPGSFCFLMHKDYVDHDIWFDSYYAEYVSLQDQTTFFSITWDKYKQKYSHVKIILSMNIQTIKKDEIRIPVPAKSHIVALGNHEDTLWEPGDVHAPVIHKESDWLLTTIAVDMGQTQKQGNCKNPFLHPTLPPDEIVIFRPPPAGCPFSQPGELWLLNKTLYGLQHSPKHWYDALCQKR